MNKRRYLALLLVAVFTIGTILVPERTTYAAKKTQLNKTIEIGKTVTLKLKNAPKGKKIKWTSSKKKVAVVNSKGRVQGKSAGKAKITAKVGKKKYTCTVTVKKKEKPQQMTTEAPSTQTVTETPTTTEIPTTEAPTTEAPATEKDLLKNADIKKVTINNITYNVTTDQTLSKHASNVSSIPSHDIKIVIDNDYGYLVMDAGNGIWDNFEFLKYFGNIRAYDKNNKDITNDVIVCSPQREPQNGWVTYLYIYVKDSYGNETAKNVFVKFTNVFESDDDYFNENNLISDDPIIYGSKRESKNQMQ